MKRTKLLMLVVLLSMLISSICYAELPERVQGMVKEGRALIEAGQYKEAANSLGQILTELGGSTTDPEVDALGATIQAYGLSRSGEAYIPLAKQFLSRAIDKDPKWEYPKKLLKDMDNK